MIMIVWLLLVLMGLLWWIFETCSGAPEDVEWMEEDDD